MKNRTQTWIAVFLGAIGLLFAAGMGLWVYVSATATPLHPSAGAVPSTTRSAPSTRWDDAVEQARQTVRTALAEQNLPGVSVAVGTAGNVVWAEGFGFADLDTRATITPETRFRLGTASIALTSAAVGVLLEKNALNLDAEIQAYVPQFPQKQWPLTVRHLMGHVAGMRSDGGDEGALLGTHCERPVEALSAFAGQALLFEPGTAYHESHYDWILVSAAIEAAAQEPFLRFMRKQVFEPLAMDDTLPDSTTDAISDRATTYFPRFAADPRYGPDPMREVDYSCYAGSSVFLSTPSDLVRFAMAMANGTLIQPATVQLLQSEQHTTAGKATGYGLGWDHETATVSGEPTTVIGHDGELLGGMAVSLVTLPKYGITVAVTANISYAQTFDLAVQIAQAFVNRPPS